ncbi:MAG TPA: M50 family metallopeptidase [Solirubrobacteraceae bacterium]|nr:M50 family metallopeptidase [Solirubrobacteraceae bacterium]
MSWVLTILGIVLLIVLHELGHFTVAKAVGMRVERFSLFFPPTIARIRRGETEYAIGALPLGGYVKITGMTPEELARPSAGAAAAAILPGAAQERSPEGEHEAVGELDAEITRRAYYNQAPWKRVVVILAGPAVNILIAFLLFWGILYAGNLDGATAVGNLDQSTQTVVATTAVQSILPGEPAQGVLRPGDRIVAVGGRPATVADVQSAIEGDRCSGTQVAGCRATAPVRLTLRRGARDVPVSVYPRYEPKVKRMLIGFDFGEQARSYGALAAAREAVAGMWHITWQTLTGFAHALESSKARHELSSIVGITQAAHATVVAGAGFALVALGFISLILAVINLFPFLPLDGGHILWALAEKVRGRRISLVAMYRFSSVGIVLLLFLVINGFSNDIGRLGG